MRPILLLEAPFDPLDKQFAYVAMGKPGFHPRRSYEKLTARLPLQASPTDLNAPVSPYVPQILWVRGT